MIYKAVEVIWIFLADGRAGTEGSIRGPRGPKKRFILQFIFSPLNLQFIFSLNLQFIFSYNNQVMVFYVSRGIFALERRMVCLEKRSTTSRGVGAKYVSRGQNQTEPTFVLTSLEVLKPYHPYISRGTKPYRPYVSRGSKPYQS